ncbi:hypothetical protein KGQ20_18325 [Catenulispora sp. NF23]|uniref:Uncharacterized protein n=1 Tax=Catenulispora pinistramenti TaxID=2705254 RepID=A0ABS5KYL6_9ACTN|nr:hypothetical protein [Catenulispora pinistramenti]MBS2534732.1 hypothetical protein [Catenulispora pinistramenti]MBS2551153.1 hypothetical protein [Catenulispora pinistramenti]
MKKGYRKFAAAAALASALAVGAMTAAPASATVIHPHCHQGSVCHPW